MQVTLFNKNGQSLSTPAMNITLGAHKNHGFNIAEWAAGHDGFEEGSLLVSYHSVSLAISADTAGGDHGITVTANGQQSNSVNFFVQLPTKLRRDDLGQLQNEDGGCGATRLLNYTLLDQETEAAPIKTNGVISETISDQTSTLQGVGCTASPSQNMDQGAFPDRVGYLIPTCPAAFTVTCTQSFKVTLGGHEYSLNSHNTVSMGRNADGSKFVNITFTQ